jgi:CheY-like chemotaxis protein
MSETQTTAVRTPTVYFIDDSATMREVIKIAFRKENIHIITCADAATAMEQFSQVPPDAVITDVIMPDKDGYEVCQFIKQHEQFANTPVILMSGVVNRTVAERATEVKADELIRKPFQPQDLLMRVKSLLYPKSAVVLAATDYSSEPAQSASNGSSSAASSGLAGLFSSNPAPATQRPNGSLTAVAPSPNAPASSVSPVARPAVPTAEIQKLKNEIRRFELLVKKLHAELEAEHQYCAALEAHFKTLQDSE